MKLKVYAGLLTFFAAMVIGSEGVKLALPTADILDVIVYSVFLAVAISAVFIALIERKPHRRRTVNWKATNGIQVPTVRSSRGRWCA